jgi:hypothetical protein
MSAEELAKHRQVYWEELSKGLDDCCYGPSFTEEEKRQIFAEIPDSEIIYNVENGIPPSHSLQRYIYISAILH